MGARRDRYGHRYHGHRADEPHRHRLAPGLARAVARPLRHRGSDLRVCRHDGARARLRRARASRPTRRVRLLGLVVPRGQGRLRAEGPTAGPRLHPRRSARLCVLPRREQFLGKDGILVTTKTPAEVAGRFDRYFARSRRSARSGSGGGIAPSIRSTSTAASGSRCPTPSPMVKATVVATAVDSALRLSRGEQRLNSASRLLHTDGWMARQLVTGRPRRNRAGTRSDSGDGSGSSSVRAERRVAMPRGAGLGRGASPGYAIRGRLESPRGKAGERVISGRPCRRDRSARRSHAGAASPSSSGRRADQRRPRTPGR